MRKKRIHSAETKRKIGLAQLGRKREFSEQAIKNIRLAAAKRKGIKTGPLSEETKKKISKATTGVKKTITKPNSGCFKKGRISWNQGRKKIKEKKPLIDKKTYSINGFYRREWSRKVRERDEYKCVECGKIGLVHAHHIVPWKQDETKRFDIENGITLCCSCHTKKDGFKKGFMPWITGKKHTDATKEKMKKAKIGYVPFNKGKRKLIESRKTCRVCGMEKEITDFTPRQEWYTNTCKECRNKKLKEKSNVTVV